MNLAVLPPIRPEFRKQPTGIQVGEKEHTPAEHALLREIQARLSGLGEPPQFGNRIVLKDIQNAIRMSELGEPYYMFALYRDMIQNDPHLQAECGKRIMSFMGQNETIEPYDPKNKDDVTAAEFIEDIRDHCENWREGCIHLAQGHIWPISGCEKIFARVEPDEQREFRHPTIWKLAKLHPIPWPLYTFKVAYWNVGMTGGSPQDLMTMQGFNGGSGSTPINNPAGIVAYHGDSRSQNDVLIWNPQDWHPDLRFYGTMPNGMIDWTLSTGYKPDKVRHVLHSAQVATSGMRENFGGTLRSLIPYWFYKKQLLDWYMQAMERYGAPFVVANARMNDKPTRDILTKAFEQATILKALLVPPGTKIEMQQAQTSGMSDGFAKGIEVLNTEETKAVLGQTLSTSSKGSGMMGGSGVADLHGEVKEEWSLFDKRSFSDMQKNQIFDQLLRVNGYTGRCRSVRGGVSAQQQALLSKTMLSMYQCGWKISKEDQQKVTNTFAFKMEPFDPQANQQGKNPNSHTD